MPTKPDAEIYHQAPENRAPGIQLKGGRRGYMNKGSQDHNGEIYRDSWDQTCGNS